MVQEERGLERTLLVIKPDGVRNRLIGEVIKRLEAEGFEIRALKMVWLTREMASQFYAVHRGKPFYEPLVEFMASDRCVAMVLERKDAVAYLRYMIGATDPAEAAKGTIRRDLATDKQHNVVHAADSPQNAVWEISFFFSPEEVF